MKTIYSIGRDPGCDIYLYDDRNVISRTHAILKIGKGGKYFISDQSMNGTYVNGIKIAQGVPVPVTRKDIISFAHMAELDWGMVPNPYGRLLGTIAISALVVLAVCGIVWGVLKYQSADQAETQESVPVQMAPAPPPPPAPAVDENAKDIVAEKNKEIEAAVKARKKKAAEKAKAEEKTAEKAETKANSEVTKKAETQKDTLTFDPIV